ncbi:MAG: hypothetical protein JJU40_03255 [Rhodobacteraceae bacterium]|nr:hypothetical protein [Paracoccaceae bacterium]
MTHHAHPDIRRAADGTIDFAYYDCRARGLRGAAIVHAPSHLATRMRRILDVTGRIAAAIRSVMTIPASTRHARNGRLRGSDPRCG